MDFTPASRATAPARGRRAGPVPLTGAVRRAELSASRRGGRARAVAGGAVAVAVAGALVAAAGTIAEEPASEVRVALASMGMPGASLVPLSPTSGAAGSVEPAPAPTFFFDDAADALAERAGGEAPAKPLSPAPSRRGTPAAEAVAPPVETVSAAPVARAAANGSADATGPSGDEPATLDEVAPDDSVEVEVVVGPGDTLSGILNDHGVSMEQMPSLLADEDVARLLSRLSVGQRFTIGRGPGGEFRELSGRIGKDTRVSVRRTGAGFDVSALDLPIEKERVVTSGTIEQSLYLAAEQAELKQSTIMTLADIFQWELDFARDIRKGDSFAIVYDRLYREGEYIGDGDILAAEFERGGRVHRAIRFVAEDGTSGYYSPDGTSKRRTFARHPVDVVRITSKFDPNRLHPVLHQIRAHRGVDYGAPHGSPIRATADGVVRFSGSKGAYGNTVILQHGERTKTLYAHMSRISDKSTAGARVSQGDVIGYVGNTGRVTGTHLHYEFRVDDKHVDPLTVELPAAAPIAAEHREALRALSDELVAQMRSVLPDTGRTVASNGAGAGLDALAEDVTGQRGVR